MNREEEFDKEFEDLCQRYGIVFAVMGIMQTEDRGPLPGPGEPGEFVVRATVKCALDGLLDYDKEQLVMREQRFLAGWLKNRGVGG